MNCKEARELWVRLEDGAEDSTAHAALSGHVGACAGCREFLSQLDAAWEALARHPEVEPSAGFKDAILRRVRLEPEDRRIRRIGPQPGWQWMAAAAGLLLVVSLLTFQFPERHRTAQVTATDQSERWEEEFMRDLDQMLQVSASEELSDYDSWPGAELETLPQEPDNTPPAEKTRKKGVGSNEGA